MSIVLDEYVVGGIVMMKRIFTIFLVSLLVIQFIPLNKASATVNGLSINATVNGKQSLEIGDDGTVTTNVSFDLEPKGTATSNERKPMDVVIVFDKSGSMAEVVSGGKTKLQLAKEAVEQAMNTFKKNSKNNQDRYGIVAFDSGVNSSYTISTLQTNPDTITNKIKNVPAEGGTNYTEALKIAENILLNSTNRSARDQYIIFMTDGQPTNSIKVESISGSYYKLINAADYYNTYGYRAYYNKYFAGQLVSVAGTSYIISDTRSTINGQKTVHYDSNGNRNVKVIEHNNSYYFHSKENSSVPTDIKNHARDQAQSIANNKMTLLSIGFGEQSQLDMNLLTELSSKSNGKAERASGENIVDIFKDISDNISAEYPSLSNGFIKFTLPAGVTVQQTDSVSIIKENNKDVVYMNLNNIKFNPNPPSKGDPSLSYSLPLIFTQPGNYQFTFDVVYNSGAVKVEGLRYVTEVIVPLKSIGFTQRTLTLEIGQKVNISSYMSFNPINATNKLIREIKNDFSTPINPIVISKENGDWYITAKEIGYTEVKAVADFRHPSIVSEPLTVVVKRESTGPDTGDNDGTESFGKW